MYVYHTIDYFQTSIETKTYIQVGKAMFLIYLNKNYRGFAKNLKCFARVHKTGQKRIILQLTDLFM